MHLGFYRAYSIRNRFLYDDLRITWLQYAMPTVENTAIIAIARYVT